MKRRRTVADSTRDLGCEIMLTRNLVLRGGLTDLVPARASCFPACDGNTGLYWRTKIGGRRVGHSGNDPGLQTEMLADPTANTT